MSKAKIMNRDNTIINDKNESLSNNLPLQRS